jgi:PKD domain
VTAGPRNGRVRLSVLLLAVVVGLCGAGIAQAALVSQPTLALPAFTKGEPLQPPVPGTFRLSVRWRPPVFSPESANDRLEGNMSASGSGGGGFTVTGLGLNSYGGSFSASFADGAQVLVTLAACVTSPPTTPCPGAAPVFGVTRLDGTPPSGTVQINGGAAATNNREVTLNLAATDPLIDGLPGSASGVNQYAVDIDNDGVFPCTFLVIPPATSDTSGCAGNFAPTASTTLTANDGVKTVGVKFGDAARTISAPCNPPFCFILFTGAILGNEGPVATDTIILDTAKPIALSTQDRFTIERGGTVSFDSATSLDQNPAIAAGVDPGAATWDFKDGTPQATGQKVTHTFNQVGTFVGELRVKDRAGNESDPRQFSVTVSLRPGETVAGGGTVGAVTAGQGAAAFRIDRVKVSARYKRSRLSGSIALTGSASASGPLVVEVRPTRGGKLRRLATTVAVGPFSKTLRLPADLLPGSYRLVFAGPGGSLNSSLKLISPREGVLRSGTVRASRRSALATFTLAAQPVRALRGGLTVAWSQGARKLGLVKVSSGARIRAALPAGATLAAGRLRAELRAGGTVVGDAATRRR